MKILQTHGHPVSEIPPFGNIDLGIPVSRFFLMGFRPGDAVDVEFSNGFAFRNIPVFSGFYGAGHMPCLYAASSFYPHVGIGCPISGNPWRMAGVEPGDTARIILRRRRGYSQLEERMSLPAMVRPTHARTPQQNANWRSLGAGNIAPNTIYRSCSPIRNDSAGAPIACALMEEAGIRSVLNLSDTPAMLQSSEERASEHAAPYLDLCDEGLVLPLHLGVDYHLQENAHTLAHGLSWLASQPKPALIHCKLGLDRTGVVCVLLEMLAGCSYEDIERDYQTSYLNLFGPPPRGRRSYALCDVRFGELLDFLLSFVEGTNGKNDEPSTRKNPKEARERAASTAQCPSSETPRQAARAYLTFGGLDAEQIDSIERMLEGEDDTSERVTR